MKFTTNLPGESLETAFILAKHYMYVYEKNAASIEVNKVVIEIVRNDSYENVLKKYQIKFEKIHSDIG